MVRNALPSPRPIITTLWSGSTRALVTYQHGSCGSSTRGRAAVLRRKRDNHAKGGVPRPPRGSSRIVAIITLVVHELLRRAWGE